MQWTHIQRYIVLCVLLLLGIILLWICLLKIIHRLKVTEIQNNIVKDYTYNINISLCLVKKKAKNISFLKVRSKTEKVSLRTGNIFKGFFLIFQTYFSRTGLKLLRNNSCDKDGESFERPRGKRESMCERERNDKQTVMRTLDRKRCDQGADSETAAEFLNHDASVLPRGNLNVVNADNEIIIVDLHKSEDGHNVKFRQSKKCLDTRLERLERSNKHHYEKLNRDGERSDNHYAKLVQDGYLPPNMQASV